MREGMALMSIFSRRLDVTPAELVHRLSETHSMLSLVVRQAVEATVNRDHGVGENMYQVMQYQTDGLVAFAVEFTIRNILSPREADVILPDMYMLRAYDRSHYVKRFQDIPAEMGRVSHARFEYLMAGMAFQECCGTTGNTDADNLVKQFGANAFANVFDTVKKELKQVRLIRL